jgi:hypothetical protein
MTWDPRPTLQQLKSILANATMFPGGVQIGEPFSPVSDTTAAIMLQAYDPAGTTLSDTIDVWEVLVRLYAKAGMTPTDAETVELTLAYGFSQVAAALAGAFTLGGTVRAIDWAGEEAGRRLAAKWGHIVMSGTIFRVVDVSVPVIVDDSATFAA